MKTIKLFALVGIFCVSLRPLPTVAFSMEQRSDDLPNYVVIGAFAVHKNAIRFANYALKDLSLDAKFEMNPHRNLYYVYVLRTLDRDHAIAEALRLREQSKLKDTWVYSGSLGKEISQPSTSVDINPITGGSLETVSSNSPVVDEVVTAEIAEKPASLVTVVSASTDPTSDDETDGKSFIFKITRAVDNANIEGEVDIIDTEKLRKLGTYKGNMPVRISSPSGNSSSISVACEVFGYRKEQRVIDYNNPLTEDIEKDASGAVVIPFELTRLQKGDVAVMYNVYFFKDAGVMRPESRYEVNSLLQMLLENEKYSIKIHGHTNGGAAGKIISLEKNATNFFSLSNTKEGFGSAKKLSEERASVIKSFLVSNGINPKRMEVKAWGGKRPMFDKHHTRAQENVRVEIEIMEDK